MRTTNIRFNGLASGLDTESLVNAMLMPYKAKTDGGKQQQLLLEMKKDVWKETNNKLYSFYTSQLDKLRLQSTFNKKDVSLSNPGVIEVKDAGNIPDGTHTIKVDGLAEGAHLKTESIKNKVVDLSKKTQLSELGITADTTIEVQYKKSDGSYGTTSITLKHDMEIGDVEKAFQTALPEANVSFDTELGAFLISSKKTGKSQEMSLKVTSGAIDTLEKLGFNAPGGEVSGTGKNTNATYNGVKIDSESNNVKVNGMDIKLVSIGETTIVGIKDTEAMVETVVKFVDEYNKLISEMNELIGAPYNKDYKPLTAEQKEGMTEEEIKLWNEKIEKSLLRKDPVLQSLTSSMREILGTSMVLDAAGNPVTLKDIGISTGTDWTERGKLHIDEKKLREAIEKDSDTVAKLFTNKETPEEAYNRDPNKKDPSLTYEQAITADNTLKNKYENVSSGIGTKLYAMFSEKLKSTTDKSANFLFNDKALDKKIREQKESVNKLQQQMERMEDMYYKRFTAMEKMMSQLNSQSSWLASQLGGM